MRSPVLLGVLVATLIALVAGAWWFMGRTELDPRQPESEPEKAGSEPAVMILFRTSDGQVLSVPDFTYGHPSLEVEDTGITYVYVTRDDSLTEQDPAYTIVYGSDSSIFLGLRMDPLSRSRARAEAKLRELLPVPDVVLCKLNIKVVVADTIESMYGSKDQGLSFCAGAVTLP